MANQLLTRQEITRDSLMILENNLKILPNLTRDYDKEFGKSGGKIGDTLYVRKPARFVGRDGQAYSPEGLTDTEVPITIDQQSGVDFEFSSAELYLSIDEFSKRYLKPAAMSISNKLDLRCGLTMMQNAQNLVGTPGITPGLSGSNAFLIYSQAGQKLFEQGFPLKDGRTLVMTPGMETGWNAYNSTQFNPQGQIGEQWVTGKITPKTLGNKNFVDQNIPSQTIGLLGGTPAVNGAGQTGNTLITNGWTASVAGLMNIGDIFSIAGVFLVNPQSRQSTGSLAQFTVQAVAASDGGGASTLTFSPAIVPSGQFQNVSASPATGALINVYGVNAAGQSALSGITTAQGLLWHEEAATFISFAGPVPNNADMAYEEKSPDIGVSLRFLRLMDGVRDMWPCRFDVYYGIAPLYAEACVRICGS